MKTCEHCGASFPFMVVVNGRRRNLCSRRYCLTCSPFGARNTGTMAARQARVKPRACTRCGKIYVHRLVRGSSAVYCNGCRTRVRLDLMRRKAVAYKGGACVRCGYNKTYAALEFHHVDPAQKLFMISRNYNRRWAVLQTELDKCILLCANCHAETHVGVDAQFPARLVQQQNT